MADNAPKEKTEVTGESNRDVQQTPPDKTTVVSGPQAAEKTALAHVPDHHLLRCVGRGGYGEVWLARNVMGTYRAVKIVYRKNFENDRPYEREFDGIQMFEPISRSHEGLVDILHVGRNDQAGYFYYVMELADDAHGESDKAGERESEMLSPAPSPTFSPATFTPRTLQSDLKHRGRLSPGECVPLCLALTRALGYLHEQELVHRDIKPSNIIFVKGVAKLADIGLVTGTEATQSYVGTEGFIPPEGPGTPQADIYSLGKVFYEMITGKDRHDFPDWPTALRRENAGREGLLELNEVVVKACAAEVGNRYQSAHEMEKELALLQGGQSLRGHRMTRKRWFAVKALGLAAAALALVLWGLWFVKGERSRRNAATVAGSKAVAVLPFVNTGANKDDDYFSDGLSDEIRAALSKVSGLKVASRTASFAFRGQAGDIQRIGEQLRVGAVLEGSFTKEGTKLHIQTQLINVSDGFALWTETYERQMRGIDDVIGIQSDVALQVATALKVKLLPVEQRQAKKRPTENLDALLIYWQAKCHLNQGSRADITNCIDLTSQATRLDPDFAAAWTVRAWAYLRMDRFHEPGKDWGTKAFAATEIALTLDHDSAEAYAVRGQTFFSPAKDWAWRNAMADERRALELNPRLEEAHEVISYIYWHLGLLDEAVAEARVALRENPQSNRARAQLGFTLIDLGRPEEALPYIEELPKSYTAWVRVWLEGLCLFYLGRTNQAPQALENLYHPDQPETLVIPSLQAMIAARAGRKDEALEKIRLASAGPTNTAHYHHIAYQIAVAYSLMNEKKLALEWLKRSADNGCPCYRYFEIDPTLDNLRHDSGFISFMNQEKGNWERRKADLFGSASAVKQTGR